MLRAAIVLAMALVTLVAPRAEAQECNDDTKSCLRDADCDAELGERCVSSLDIGASKFCQVTCVNGTDQMDPSKCEWGETCAPARTVANTSTFSCQPTAFGMDLNLLDTCIYHFIESVPVEFGENACSLQSRLASMMGDGVAPFDIFDLDRCIQDFLDQPACSEEEGCGVDDQGRSRGQYCDEETPCGGGLFCNEQLNRCDRQCGYIPDRSRTKDGKKKQVLLERPCTRPLHMCDLSQGKCEPVKMGGESCQFDSECKEGTYCRDGKCQLTCALDSECPFGAYCQLGQCQPECYQNLDCADSSWFCNAENRCQPKPTGSSATPFDPGAYSVRFGTTSLRLDTFQDRAEIPVVVMSNRDQREVFNDSNILFGYRLEASYGLKDAPECKTDRLADDPVLLAKCRVNPSQYFLLQERPFGTVYATGDAAMPVRIDHVAAKSLEPGNYPVTLRAFFTNGNSATVEIMFHKPSVSGGYTGRVSLFTGGPPVTGGDGDIVNHLGDANVTLKVKLSDSTNDVRWNDLLTAQNLREAAEEFEDLSYGRLVHGYLDGNESPVFDFPEAKKRTENQVRVVGIYNAAKGRMRLIGVIDLPPDYCRARTNNWTCGLNAVATNALEARNRFGRKVRRIFQWIGPFNERTGEFSGLYREVIAGLTPTDLVFEGAFRVTKSSETVPTISLASLLKPYRADDPTTHPVDFPTREGLLTAANNEVNASCSAATQTSAKNIFASRDAFECHLGVKEGCTKGAAIFPDGVRLGGAIGAAMSALDQPGNGTNARTLSEHVKTLVTSTFCDDTASASTAGVPNTCIDRKAVACGLALYRKALVADWVSMAQVADQLAPGDSFTGAPVFCGQRPGTASCGGNAVSCSCVPAPEFAPSLFTLQEHGAFYREVVGRAALDAGNAMSKAFFLPYTTQQTGLGQAITSKRTALFEALSYYDVARGSMFSSTATDLLYKFPADAFIKNGEEWVQQMSGLLDDQLGALTEVADTERRLAGAGSEQSFMVAQHALHVSFLERALVAAIEARWEGDNYISSPGGANFFSASNAFLAKYDETKTPLGVTPNRTYFASTSAAKPNWKYIRDQLSRELSDRNDITTLVSRVEAAKQSMSDAIDTRQSLTRTIRESVAGYETQLDALCGPEEALPVACGAPVLCQEDSECSQYSTDEVTSKCKYGQCTNVRDVAIKAATADCRGEDCAFPYVCETPECNTVARKFETATAGQTSCRADTYALTVVGADGTSRPCMRGAVGALMQERELLEMRRKHVINLFAESLRKVDQQHARIEEVRRVNDETSKTITERNSTLSKIESGVNTAMKVYEEAMALAQQADCITVTGTAGGGNCLTAALAVAARKGAAEVKERALNELEEARLAAIALAEEQLAEQATDKEVMPLYEHLDNLTSDVQKHVGDYENVVQQLFNLDARIADTHYVALRTAERYNQEIGEEIAFFAELTGWKGNAILTRNAEVIAANAKFQRALMLAYELVQAVRYELAFDYVFKNLRAENVYQAITLTDLQELLAWIDELMEDKCELYHQNDIGDCQSDNNSDVVAVSLQRAMFPYLTDLVDPETGTTLSIGQQFHRLITSSAFVRKRVVDGNIVPQIELPFGMWLGEFDRIRDPESEADITPRQCAMLLQPEGVSVEVVGNEALTFHLPAFLIRGGTDLQRSCTKAASGKRPINPYSVGWLGGSSQAAAEFQSVASFQHTRVTDGNPRWVTAFADRALSAPSYLFSIPLNHADGQKLVKPAPNTVPPIVKDIIIRFKYRSITFRD